MPASLEVDHEQMRMLTYELGYEEAAARVGLKAATLRQWACREGWEARRPASVRPSPTKLKPVTLVTSPAQALVEAFRDDMVQTRLSTSRSARKAAETLEKRTGEQLLADGGVTMLNVSKNSALVHDWAGQGNTAKVTLCIQQMDSEVEIQIPIAEDDEAFT